MLEITKNIYQVPIPLPKSPLKELNCFIIKGADRNLIVDTGFNTKEGEEALYGALSRLGITMDHTDIFITHLHSDHCGLVEKLTRPDNKIYISRLDGDDVNRQIHKEYWDVLLTYHKLMGFPKDGELSYTDHPGYAGGIRNPVKFQYIEEGEILKVGGYDFEVIDLKGHTPGHLGLYEKKHKILFCGDHILNKITPNINLWDFDEDYLGLFLENLKKVREIEVNYLLSAHRALIENHKERIDALLCHHERRLNEILNILKEKDSTVYECSFGVTWDFNGGLFGSFPPAQKWFAASEVFAHLEHLRRKGLITFYETDGAYTYKHIHVSQ